MWRKFMTTSELRKLADDMLAGSNDARWRLVIAHEPLFRKQAKYHLKLYGLSLDNVEGLHSHLLMTAYEVAPKYDPERAKFATFLYWHLRTAGHEYCAEKRFGVKLSASVIQDLWRVQRTKAAFKKAGLPVTAEAVALELGKSQAYAKVFLDHYNGSAARSLSDRITAVGEDTDTTLLDLMVDENALNGEESIVTMSVIRRKHKLLSEAIEKLPDRHKEILLKRYLSGGDDVTTLDVIAADYDLSKERVRQIIKAALSKIRDHIKKQGGV